MGPEVGWEVWLFLAGGVAVVLVGVVSVVKWRLEEPQREQQRFEQEMVDRDRARWAAEQQWVDSESLPLTDQDYYATAWEFAQDLARMKALGYDLQWQQHLEDGTIAATYVLTPAYQQRKRKAAPMS